MYNEISMTRLLAHYSNNGFDISTTNTRKLDSKDPILAIFSGEYQLNQIKPNHINRTMLLIENLRFIY